MISVSHQQWKDLANQPGKNNRAHNKISEDSMISVKYIPFQKTVSRKRINGKIKKNRKNCFMLKKPNIHVSHEVTRQFNKMSM